MRQTQIGRPKFLYTNRAVELGYLDN